jgi:hypothetical protein
LVNLAKFSLMTQLIDILVILSVLVVLTSAIGAFWKYLNLRERELTWKKSTLVFEIARQLEGNPAMQRARAILAGRNFVTKLEDLLGREEKTLSQSELGLKQDLDTLFGTLERIAHAVTVTKALSRTETECFSWYFRKIQSHPILSKYFYDSGFLDLWDFAVSWGEKLEMELP